MVVYLSTGGIAVAGQILIDRDIAPLVAKSGDFSKQMGGIVHTRLPTFPEIGVISVQFAGFLDESLAFSRKERRESVREYFDPSLSDKRWLES
jgi:hypothetical protein